MQLRTSPGGSMPSSRRRRPLEPPSSLTVTTAVRSEMNGPLHGDSPAAVVYRLSPLRSVDRPVPPPIATTRRPRIGRLFCSAFGDINSLQRFLCSELDGGGSVGSG